MNANEVIGRLATQGLGKSVHANDQVNMGQSSNDVIPTAIHVSAAIAVRRHLVPALEHAPEAVRARMVEHDEERGDRAEALEAGEEPRRPPVVVAHQAASA